MEGLESRRLLATDVTLAGGTLQLAESNAADVSDLTMQFDGATFTFQEGATGPNITFSGGVPVGVTVVNAKTFTIANNAAGFTRIVATLGLNADKFTFAAGQNAAIKPLAVNLGAAGDTIALQSSIAITTGDLTLSNATSITLGTNVNLSASGNVQISSPLQLPATGTNSVSGATTIFSSSITGGAVLSIGATTQVALQGAINVGALTANSLAVAINQPVVTTTGAIVLTGSVSLASNASLRSAASNIQINGPLTLGAAGTNLLDAATTVTIGSQVTGSSNLEIKATSATLNTVNILGSGTLKVTAGAIGLQGSTQAGSGVELIGDTTLTNSVLLGSGLSVKVDGGLILGGPGPHFLVSNTQDMTVTGQLTGSATLSVNAKAVNLAEVNMAEQITISTTNLVANGAISAKQLTVIGDNTGAFTLSGAVTATGGNVELRNATTLAIAQSITASASILFDAISNLQIAGNVVLSATAGNLMITPATAVVHLTGASGTSNTFQAGALVVLPVLTDDAGAQNPSLVTINSGGNITLGATTLVGALDVNLNALGINQTVPFTATGSIIAGAVDISGRAGALDDDRAVLQGSLHATTGNLILQSLDEVQLSPNVSLQSTAGGVVVDASLTLPLTGTNPISGSTGVTIGGKVTGGADLSITSPVAVSLLEVDITGALDVTSAAIILQQDVKANAGIDLMGTTTLGTGVTLQTAGDVQVIGALILGATGLNEILPTAANVSITGQVSGGAGFKINAASNVVLAGVNIGGALNATATNLAWDADVTASSILLTGATALDPAVKLTATAGAIQIVGPLAIGNTGTNLLTASTSVIVTGATSGNGSLSIDANTSTSLQAVTIGGALTIDSAAIALHKTVSATAGIDITGNTTLDANVNLQSAGAVDLDGTLALGGAATINTISPATSVTITGLVSGAAGLTISATNSVSLAGVNIGGTLLVTAPAIALHQAVTAATGITLTGNTTLDANVALLATGGNIGITGALALGAAGTNSVTAANSITITGPVSGSAALALDAVNVSLAAVIIGGNLTINAKDIAAGALSANSIAVLGDGGGTFNFSGTVSATGGDVQLDNASIVLAAQSITASNSILVTAVTDLFLAGNVTLSATTSDLSITPVATIVHLTGANATANTFRAGRDVVLPNLTDDAGAENPSLVTIQSGRQITLGPTALVRSLVVQLDVLGANEFATFTSASITAGAIDISGRASAPNTLGDDFAQLNGALHATSGNLLLQSFSQVLLATGVDLLSDTGSVRAVAFVGSLLLAGLGGTNNIVAGIGAPEGVDVALPSVAGVGNVATSLVVSADEDVSITNINLPASYAVTINVDQIAGDSALPEDDDPTNKAGDLTIGPIVAGSVLINSGSSETIASNITANTFIEVNIAESSAAVPSDLTVSSGIVLQAGATLKLTAGDNVTVKSAASLQATGALSIAADVGSNDAAGAVIRFESFVGSFSGHDVLIEGAGDADELYLPVTWLTAGNRVVVRMHDGNDYVALQYPANFTGPSSQTFLTIDSGDQAGDVDRDKVDVDAHLDTVARKVQFTYQGPLNSDGNLDGENTRLLTDANANNRDTLAIDITSTETYFVRTALNLASQLYVIGGAANKNIITLGDINNNGTIDDFRDDTVAGNRRFGSSNFAVVRAVGGALADGIRVNDLTPAISRAQVILIEAKGGSGTITDNKHVFTPAGTPVFPGQTVGAPYGEQILGNANIPNLILGGSDVPFAPLFGAPGNANPALEKPLLQENSRANILTGAAGDLVLTDRALKLLAGGIIDAPANFNYAGGNFRDIALGGNVALESNGDRDRFDKSAAVLGCGAANTILFAGQPTGIGVCDWLKARFPSLSVFQQEVLLTNAYLRIKGFDLRLLAQSPPPPNSQAGPEPGSTTSPSTSPLVNITLPSGPVVAGFASEIKLQAIDFATGLPVPGASFQIDVDNNGSVDAELVDVTGQGVTWSAVFSHYGSTPLRVTALDAAHVAGPSQVTSLNVQAAALVDGDLLIGGTSANDQILLFPGNDGLTVRVNGQRLGPYVLDASQQIIIHSQAGNDQIAAARNLTSPVTVDGGAGNDLILGGAAGDVLQGSTGRDYLFGQGGEDRLDGGADDDRLYGGAGNDALYGSEGDDIIQGSDGNDQLYGQQGRDVLLGGRGIDLIVGGAAEDILIGGTTLYDQNDDALITLLTAWKQNVDAALRIGSISDPAFAATLNEMTVLDDESEDNLFGEAGEDWFFLFDLDTVQS